MSSFFLLTARGSECISLKRGGIAPGRKSGIFNPIASMHGIFTYIWLIFMVNLNVGKYTIHGCYGNNKGWGNFIYFITP